MDNSEKKSICPQYYWEEIGTTSVTLTLYTYYIDSLQGEEVKNTIE